MKVLLFAIAVAAAAQTAGLEVRVRSAMARSAQQQAAVEALRTRNFGRLQAILQTEAANQPQQRGELLAIAGAAAFLSGNPTLAAEELTEAQSLGPLDDADAFTLAMAWIRLGDDERARTVISALQKKHPSQTIYVYWLGKLDYDQRRYSDAVKKLSRASELDPKSARVWDALGLAYDMEGLIDKALPAFKTATELNRAEAHPSPWPPNDLGALLLRMDRPQDAEASLREALKYDSSFAQAHYRLGRALDMQGREEEAVSEYASAIHDDPGFPEPCYSLGLLYRKLGRSQEATQMFAEYRKRSGK